MTTEQLARRLRRIYQDSLRCHATYEASVEKITQLSLSGDQYALAVETLDFVMDCTITPEYAAAQVLRATAPGSS